MRSFLVGSPGIGKSTLLILMAFYLVLKHKKNVLVYRWLDKGDCLFYLGYQAGTVVYFTVEGCSPELVVAIYEELGKHQGFSNVWLLLDGIQYDCIPRRLIHFRMLAASQQVLPKEHADEHAYYCLLPCWKKQDLFKLGREVCNFEEKDMEDRFNISGGSVRVFSIEGIDHLNAMRRKISRACTEVEGTLLLFSDGRNIQAGKNQIDRLRHTFVEDTQVPSNYLTDSNWEQRVDSQYAIDLLKNRIQSQELFPLQLCRVRDCVSEFGTRFFNTSGKISRKLTCCSFVVIAPYTSASM
ncbi:hypothetical protein V7S43_014269 [Phytophthora oleae]|uniref:Crinkler (CRN) family protein n=1 Tax=Phytophthora oleae TaxID=2107226 RepID=A0ABD3F2Z3_9STRA